MRTRELVVNSFIFALFASLLVFSAVTRTDSPAATAGFSAAEAAAKDTKPSPTAAAEAATIRIDGNGYYAGTGIVISNDGHVLTALQVVGGWRYAAYTVGVDKLPAKVVAIDEAHGIAVLCSSAAAGKPVSLATERSAKNTPMTMFGFRLVSSDPPMIERRKESGYMFDPSFRGESSSSLDLRDIVIVRLKNGSSLRPKAEGLPVISAKTGKIEGIVIGHMERSDVNDLIVMPASVVTAFLEKNRIVLR